MGVGGAARGRDGSGRGFPGSHDAGDSAGADAAVEEQRAGRHELRGVRARARAVRGRDGAAGEGPAADVFL